MNDILEKIFDGKVEAKNKENDEIGKSHDLPYNPKDTIPVEDEAPKTEKNQDTDDKIDTTQKTEESNSNDSAKKIDNEEISALKKALEDSKKWGHKKNSAYVNAKKKVSEFLKKLNEDEILTSDEISNVMSYFDNVDPEQSETNTTSVVDPYKEITDKLNQEFQMYRKYNKDPDSEENYKAFFYFFPMLSVDEQQEMLTYIQEEEPTVSLEKVMIIGKDFNDTMLKGSKKHNNDILKYVKHLQQENEKLKNDNITLKKNIDTNYGKVHNRSMTARSSHEVINNYKLSGDHMADIFNGKI